MMKIIYLLLAFVAVSNAVTRHATLSSGHIKQGAGATGVIVKQKNKNDYEIKWQEKFDSKNSLNVYFAGRFEGQRKTVRLANLCDSYEKKSLKYRVKNFVLSKLTNSNACPIRKGVKKVNFPLTSVYKTDFKYCGPMSAMFDIFRNNVSNPNETPLLISASFKGTITGSNCPE